MHTTLKHTKCEHKQSIHKNNETSKGIEYGSHTIIHAKLEMTSPGDTDEVEADAAADTIIGGGKIARSFFGSGNTGGEAVPRAIANQLTQMQGGGQQLPDGLRHMMERGFGRDFSQVRLHTGNEAATISSSIHAKAFTLGNDIYFNRNQYAPSTQQGQHLIAHELAHVVQNNGKVARESDYEGDKTIATNFFFSNLDFALFCDFLEKKYKLKWNKDISNNDCDISILDRAVIAIYNIEFAKAIKSDNNLDNITNHAIAYHNTIAILSEPPNDDRWTTFVNKMKEIAKIRQYYFRHANYTVVGDRYYLNEDINEHVYYTIPYELEPDKKFRDQINTIDINVTLDNRKAIKKAVFHVANSLDSDAAIKTFKNEDFVGNNSRQFSKNISIFVEKWINNEYEKNRKDVYMKYDSIFWIETKMPTYVQLINKCDEMITDKSKNGKILEKEAIIMFKNILKNHLIINIAEYNKSYTYYDKSKENTIIDLYFYTIWNWGLFCDYLAIHFKEAYDRLKLKKDNNNFSPSILEKVVDAIIYEETKKRKINEKLAYEHVISILSNAPKNLVIVISKMKEIAIIKFNTYNSILKDKIEGIPGNNWAVYLNLLYKEQEDKIKNVNFTTHVIKVAESLSLDAAQKVWGNTDNTEQCATKFNKQVSTFVTEWVKHQYFIDRNGKRSWNVDTEKYTYEKLIEKCNYLVLITLSDSHKSVSEKEYKIRTLNLFKNILQYRLTTLKNYVRVPNFLIAGKTWENIFLKELNMIFSFFSGIVIEVLVISNKYKFFADLFLDITPTIIGLLIDWHKELIDTDELIKEICKTVLTSFVSKGITTGISKTFENIQTKNLENVLEEIKGHYGKLPIDNIDINSDYIKNITKKVKIKNSIITLESNVLEFTTDKFINFGTDWMLYPNKELSYDMNITDYMDFGVSFIDYIYDLNLEINKVKDL